MSLFRHVRPLLTVKSGTKTDAIGPVYAVLPSDSDTTPDYAMELRLMVQLPTPPPPPIGVPGVLGELGHVCPTVSPALPVGIAPLPTEPVVAPMIGASVWAISADPESASDGPDEVELPDIVDVPVATVIVETSTDRVSWAAVMEPIAVDVLPVFTDVVVLGPYVRARTSSAGLDHEVEVKLLANASFRLEFA